MRWVNGMLLVVGGAVGSVAWMAGVDRYVYGDRVPPGQLAAERAWAEDFAGREVERERADRRRAEEELAAVKARLDAMVRADQMRRLGFTGGGAVLVPGPIGGAEVAPEDRIPPQGLPVPAEKK